MQSGKHQLLLIELVRFLAALSVLVWHYQHFTYVHFQPVQLVVSSQPFYSLLWPVYERGLLGVQVFWAVSGFIFFWKYKAPLASRLVDARAFFVLRFSRLYPLHLLTLLLVCVLQWVYHSINQGYFVYGHFDLGHFVPQILFASNWLSNDLSFNGPIWSVSSEILVYVFFYCYVTQWNPGVRTTLGVFMACVLLSFLHLDLNATNCLKYFLLGGLSFEFHRRMQGRTDQKRFELRLVLALGIILFGLFLGYQWGLLRFRHYTFVLLLLIPVVLYFSPSEFRLGRGVGDILRGLGNLTYSSYLVHFPIQLMIVSWYSYRHMSIPFYDARFFFAYLTAVLVAAFLTYRLFELPMQNLIRMNWLPK